MLSLDNPLYFHSEIYFVLAISLKYLYIVWNTKSICVPSSSKWLLPLKQPMSIVFNFLNSFSTMKSFVLFELIFWLKFLSLSSKSVFITKSVCFNLALKIPTAKLLNSGEVIYLLWSWSVISFQH